MLLAICLTLLAQDSAPTEAPDARDVQRAGILIGIDFTDEELELMLGDVRDSLAGYGTMRERSPGNEVFPATGLSPLLPGMARRRAPMATGKPYMLEGDPEMEAHAFASIDELGRLLRSGKLTCVQLAEMYLARLEKLDKELHCVISFTRERALAQARILDAELAAGKDRGRLHGIPWGAKDLLAARGARTTWGAKPFEEQVLDYDAAVIERLDAAGAVLIAKLTLGALAWGDVWYGETTRNPWNPEQGSSGSSAGSASATAAGGVAFAIGTETLGSIISPSDRCGNSSLRPTFGRVSRHGAMALSWSMDKIGPICRSARDASLVFDAIHGADPRDPSARDADFDEGGIPDWKELRVGIPKGAFEGRGEMYAHVLEDLKENGATVVDIELPDYPIGEMLIILSAEAAAAFDDITRDGRDNQLVRQVKNAWPNTFRAARLIPAVEYIQAQRLRTLLMRDMDEVMKGCDVLVHPSFASGVLSITNLTGHPTVVMPCGFRENGTPFSISFTGQLDDDGGVLAVADGWQRGTSHHTRRPALEFLDEK